MEERGTQGSIPPIDPKTIVINRPPACDKFASNSVAASYWWNYGFKIIPIIPGKKIPAVPWDPWFADLSQEKINAHWARHPDHELGVIVGNDIIVLDADSPESAAALAEIEMAFDVAPNFVVKTRKGEHHYFKRATGTHAKADSHSTEKHPARLDVKTGRALVILPPSTGKTIALDEASNASELAEVGQGFIDAIARHNGRGAPRAHEMPPLPRTPTEPSNEGLSQLNALLDHIAPDGGYDDWMRVLMAIFFESGGSVEGLELADAWSSTGEKYKSSAEISCKWSSFRLDHPNPITIATLKKMVAANGHDWMAILSAAEDPFLPIDDEEGDA